jgi:transposase-like protein
MSVPRLVIADGHLGIWSALSQVLPEVAEQRCWNHKIVNVLDALLKKLKAKARELLCRIPCAATAVRQKGCATSCDPVTSTVAPQGRGDSGA